MIPSKGARGRPWAGLHQQRGFLALWLQNRRRQRSAAGSSPVPVSKLWSTDADFNAGDKADRFFVKDGKLGIGYYEDFEGTLDVTSLKWSNNQAIWSLENNAGAGSIGIAQITAGSALPAGYQAHLVGTNPNYTLSEPTTAKPCRPMFIADDLTWLVDYDGASGWFVFKYDVATGTFVKASAAFTATATYRMDCFCAGANLFVAAASTTQNTLFKLSYDSGAKQWSLVTSANVSGAMPAQQNPNPGGGADTYNAPHLLAHGDSVGRVWTFWHTMDTTDLLDHGSIHFEVRNESDLALVSGPHCLVSSQTGNNPIYAARSCHGDDIINGVTFNDGTASVGLCFSDHSLVHNPDHFGGEWFVHHHDSDPITTWQTEENIEPANSGHDDDHMAAVADASGNLYCLWKSNQDATGPILHFRKRNSAGTWATKQNPFGTGATAYTRPRLGLYGTQIFAVAMLSNNIVMRKADLATMTWDSSDTTIIDHASATVNNAVFPKETGNATSRLVCCATGSDNYRYFAVVGGAGPAAVTRNLLFVKSPTSGTDYDRSSAKFNLPPGLTALAAKYTVTFGECRGRSYTTPFATPTNNSTSTNRSRLAGWAYTGVNNAIYGCVTISTAQFRGGWQTGAGALTYCAAGAVASAVPQTIKTVVSGANVNQHVVTHNGTAYSTAGDNAAVVGANNTIAMQACWMTSGGLQHESLADYVWLEGGLGSGTYTSAWHDAGDVAAWATAVAHGEVTGDQTATLAVEGSHNGADVAASVTGLALSNGLNTLDISALGECRYVRFKVTLNCGTTASTPCLLDVQLSGFLS